MRATAGFSEFDAALQRAVADLPPSWVLLTGADSGEELGVMLKPDAGLALIGRNANPGGVGRTRGLLEAAGFRERFGGLPPIVYRPLPPPDLPLEEVLAAAFALEPPLALAEGWAEAACATLVPAEPKSPAPEAQPAPPVTPEPAEPPAPLTPALPARPRRRRRRLAWFGLIILILSGCAIAALWSFGVDIPTYLTRLSQTLGGGTQPGAARPAGPPAVADPAGEPGPFSAEGSAVLLRHARDMLIAGDSDGARRLLARAAEAGIAPAATALGKTYDPRGFPGLDAQGLQPDEQAAVHWYRQAILLGDAEAASLLAGLAAGGR